MNDYKNPCATNIFILVFSVFFVIMLAAFAIVNNLTSGTVFGTIISGLIIAFLVAIAIENS